MGLDWRVAVIDQNRFCIVGTFDLSFDECRALSDHLRGNCVRIPERSLEAIGSFEVPPEPMHYWVCEVRGEQFHQVDEKGNKHSMLHVVVNSAKELDSLRRTGRFREWDADLREPTSPPRR